jgi:dynein heavy chain 1
MKERHWKELLKKLKLSGNLQALIIGALWDIDIVRQEKIVEEVLAVARGELVLEEMLRTIKECWAAFELELVPYGGRCKLIRGWDELFAKLDEDLQNLQSMKISPYYKAFEEEVQPWDDRLQKWRLTFDTWIDVQRRWVYLQSIFLGSSDIKHQLTTEYNRFRQID